MTKEKRRHKSGGTKEAAVTKKSKADDIKSQNNKKPVLGAPLPAIFFEEVQVNKTDWRDPITRASWPSEEIGDDKASVDSSESLGGPKFESSEIAAGTVTLVNPKLMISTSDLAKRVGRRRGCKK